MGVCVSKVDGQSKETLQAHIEAANRDGPKALLQTVRYARLNKTYDKKYMRMYFAVHPSIEEVLNILMSDFVKHGATEKFGTAPRSALERDIQTKLDDLTGGGSRQQQ